MIFANVNKFFASVLMLFIASSCTNYVPPVKKIIPDKVPELSIQENTIKTGITITPEGNEELVIISPVMGIKIKDGKIRINQDVTVLDNYNMVVDSKSDLYGKDGLEIPAKETGNPKLDYAGYELKTEITPPTNISAKISVNITIKDLNNPDTPLKFSRIFNRKSISLSQGNNCIPSNQGDTTLNSTDKNSTISRTQLPSCIPIIKTYETDKNNLYKPGVDKVKEQKELTQNFVGKWELLKPNFSWESAIQIIAPEDQRSSFGLLSIHQNKFFIWERPSSTTQDVLEQITPKTFNNPDITYWKIYSGKENYYLFLKDGYIYINNENTHLLAMIGKKF